MTILSFRVVNAIWQYVSLIQEEDKVILRATGRKL